MPVFVLSLSHSGSTLLDLCLGGHPRVVGLGEVYNFARKWLPGVLDGADHRCSCGADVRACAVWAPVVLRVAGESSAPVSATYRAVGESIRALHPEGAVLLDSSKKPVALEELRSVTGSAVSVILLVRDVRGWIASRRDSPTLRQSTRPSTVLRQNGYRQVIPRLLSRRPTRLAQQWNREHTDILGSLASHRGPKFLVSYEELCLQPVKTLAALAAWLGLEPPSADPDPSSSNSHVIVGNKLRVDPERRREIVYDTRWLDRREWIAPYLGLPGLRQRNSELVWSRLRGSDWSPGPGWATVASGER